jgi:arylsulfatase A-like enzyme
MRKFNISIIVMDTMRLDTFNAISKTKGMELSQIGDFTYFDRCIAPSTWTLPSAASLFTGKYASEHGCHETRDVKCLDIERIKLRSKTFVSDLKDRGYNTYAISANPYVHPVYGFNEFDSFLEESYFTDIFGSVVEVSRKVKPLVAKYRSMYGTNVLKISAAMLREDPNLFFESVATSMVLTPIAIIKKLKAQLIENWPVEKGGKRIVATSKKLKLKEPFFLFINFMEPHDPYVGKPGKDFNWSTTFLKKKVDDNLLDLWKRLYYKASLRCYRYTLEIVKDLVKRFGDDQMILLVSDHGQSFNEHDFLGHGTMLYDEIVKVPFVAMLPKGFEGCSSPHHMSLANVRRFISLALEGDKKASRKLYSSEVKAESFGLPSNIYFMKGLDLKKLKKYDRPQTRVFR